MRTLLALTLLFSAPAFAQNVDINRIIQDAQMSAAIAQQSATIERYRRMQGTTVGNVRTYEDANGNTVVQSNTWGSPIARTIVTPQGATINIGPQGQILGSNPGNTVNVPPGLQNNPLWNPNR